MNLNFRSKPILDLWVIKSRNPMKLIGFSASYDPVVASLTSHGRHDLSLHGAFDLDFPDSETSIGCWHAGRRLEFVVGVNLSDKCVYYMAVQSSHSHDVVWCCSTAEWAVVNRDHLLHIPIGEFQYTDTLHTLLELDVHILCKFIWWPVRFYSWPFA